MWIYDEIGLEKSKQTASEYFEIDKDKNEIGDKGCGYLAKADWKLCQVAISIL